MTWETLLTFNAVLLAAILSPGPALLYFVRTTLAQGRAAGLAAGLALGMTAAGWTAMAFLGLEAIFALVPWAYLAVKIAGAAFLLYLAWTTWRDARQPIALGAGHGSSIRGAFVKAFLINLSNPKSVLFAASVLVVIFPRDMAAGAQAFVILNHFVVELTVYTSLALVLSTHAVTQRYLALKTALDRLAAGVMAALGLRLLLDRS